MQEILSNNFTPREEQILHLLANFHNYLEISTILGIRYKTVKRHIDNLREKTGLHRKELLIKYALEQGYGREVILA